MGMAALFAFLHHVSAFTLFAAIVVEFALIRSTLTVENARKILLYDMILGISALVLLLVGLLRVFYFEKGAAYYFHSIPFIAKLSLFAAIGLLSIYPTRQFLSWRPALRQGVPPTVDPARLNSLRRVTHWELALGVVLILCAALMARGIGYVGA